jgi:predicted alpha/beta-fold hydrolase
MGLLIVVLLCSGACATPLQRKPAARAEEVLSVSPNPDLTLLDHQLQNGTSKTVVVPRALLRNLIRTQKVQLSQYRELQNELDALKSIDVGSE